MDHLTDEYKGFHLCEILDCVHNEDNICNIDAWPQDELCKKNRSIRRDVLNKPTEMQFDKKDCLELSLRSPSKGAQKKWLSQDKKYVIKECFFYQMRYWNDDVVECIASQLGQQLGYNVLEQHLGKISGQDCSYSTYWGEKDFIAFERLDRQKKFLEYKTVKDRIEYALDVMYEQTGLDMTEYLAKMTILDFLVGNEDRHLFNFGVFYDGKKFEKPPLFDFGLGLFEHDACYVNKSLHECRKLMSQKPFHNWEEALDYFAEKYTFPKSKQLTVRKDFLPSTLAYEYLQYSVKRLGLEVELCD